MSPMANVKSTLIALTLPFLTGTTVNVHGVHKRRTRLIDVHEVSGVHIEAQLLIADLNDLLTLANCR